jgi:hypothetical protein
MADLLPVHGLLNGSLVLAYFRTSDVYGETGGIGDKVKIKKIATANLSGDEIIVPVKELIRTGDLIRVSARYKNSAGKFKSARLLVNQLAIGGIFGDVPANTLTGVPYKIGAGAARGNITRVGGIRRATSY